MIFYLRFTINGGSIQVIIWSLYLRVLLMRKGNNIRKRKDGLYEARYIKSRTSDGKIIYGSVYAKTIEEVEAKREALREEILMKACMPVSVGLIILGAGSHGVEVEEIANALHVFGKVSFLDDDPNNNEAIGSWEEAKDYRDEYGCAIVAVGNEKLRKLWTAKLIEMGYFVPTLVHTTAVISESAKLGAGTVICANATIGSNAKIGIGCIISPSVTVARGAKVEDWTHITAGGVVMKHA